MLIYQDNIIRMPVTIAVEKPKEGSLREQVYSYLKKRLNEGSLKPGSFLDLNALGEELGFSRTPLRDALLRLEAEGFVTIHARRGVIINPLEIATIRNSYQILGALEAAAIIESTATFSPGDIDVMNTLNDRMHVSLSHGNFNDYYTANIAFHEVYLGKSANGELKRSVRILKERLYDFPRREGYLSDWEESSVAEHDDLTRLLQNGDFQAAAVFVRDVHWSFKAQEHFIMAYYFAREAAIGPR
jgi:DNA-binding GntR family transcriptional regulator